MSDREKRDNERYDMELPIAVRWKDWSGRTREAIGMTRNMSPSGAFIVCNSPIGAGCAVDLDIDFPIVLGGCIPCRISASATIVRDITGAKHSAGYGHGITFDRFSFTRL